MRIYLRCWVKDCDILIFQRRGEETIWPLAADWWHRGNAAHMAKQYFCYIFWNSAFDWLDSHVWKYAITRLFRTSCTALDFRQPAPGPPSADYGSIWSSQKARKFRHVPKTSKVHTLYFDPQSLNQNKLLLPYCVFSINKAKVGSLSFFCYRVFLVRQLFGPPKCLWSSKHAC